jgi:hypothetical protein
MSRDLASVDEAELKLVATNGPRVFVSRVEKLRMAGAVQTIIL